MCLLVMIYLSKQLNPFYLLFTLKKPPFPIKIKEHSIVASVVNKSERKAYEPDEQLEIASPVALVKDLVTENVDGSSIYILAKLLLTLLDRILIWRLNWLIEMSFTRWELLETLKSYVFR